MRRACRLAAAGAAVVVLGGCARTPSPDESQPTPTPVVAPVAPVDHLAPGELVEGTVHAFGLVLPRVLNVDATFAQAILASGEVGVHPLTKYFRARLQGGTLDETDMTATFEHVRVPAAPDRELRVHVGRTPRGADVEIRDTTPPPAPNLPDEAARWRAVGVTPDGRLIAPTHID
jgi:hypothetical protein